MLYTGVPKDFFGAPTFFSEILQKTKNIYNHVIFHVLNNV